MNKKLLVVLFAGLLLVSAVACGKDSGDGKETDTGATVPSESYIVVPGTDESGNIVTNPATNPDAITPESDPTEDNPTFTAISKEVIVVAEQAWTRSATNLSQDSMVKLTFEGDKHTVTGESANWYRISKDGKDLYISKAVVGDITTLSTFTAVNDQVTISTGVTDGTLTVRSYPAKGDYTVRGYLKEGAVVTRVAKNDGWSRILFATKDKDGNEITKEYYISNDCIKTNAETSADTVAETSADTVAGTSGETTPETTASTEA